MTNESSLPKIGDTILLDGSPLSIEQVARVARHAAHVELAGTSREAMIQSRASVEAICDDPSPHYGINTGFGSLSTRRIATDALADLQRNLIRSHAAGIGEHLPEPIVRAMMVIQAASLARGLSGIRPVVVETILQMLKAGLAPAVPSVGSVGASGDLAPLAAVARTLMGEGEVYHRGVLRRTSDALCETQIKPVELQAKEGLALINGTHLMTARGCLLLDDLALLMRYAILACAMSMDACKTTDAFLDERVHIARCQPGPQRVAAALRACLQESEIIPSHREDDPRVQDPYSFRCAPAVLGAALDCIGYARAAITRELGAVTDNPLVFGASDIVSAGNFHGMPLAIPLDTLAIALSHIAGISERRVFLMLAASDPYSGLVPYLAPSPGVQSGYMIAQYTAAACCNEIIGLAMPASVANISTSAGIEDYNSFGPRAAAKAERALLLARQVVSIELLCAAQGLEMHRPLRSGAAIEALHAVIRQDIPSLEQDRAVTPDIEAIEALLCSPSALGTTTPPLFSQIGL